MKRFFAIMLVTILLVGMMPAVSHAAQYASVVGGWLRLRAGANFNADTITSYYTGTQVEILSKNGEWYHVRTPDGRTGYMYSQYLQLGTVITPTGSENAWVTSHNGYGVRLRKGPGTGYRVIRTYDVGTPVTVLQRGNYWCKINAGGTVGYMMTQFLNFSGSSAPVPDDGKVICYATIWSQNGYGVRLRTGPDKSYSKIGVYSVGTTVAVLEKGAVWDRIRVGSRVGWMMNEFLSYQNNNEVTNVSLNTYNPVVGTVLAVQAITPSSATVGYSWLVGDSVKGNASTYTVTSADIGKTIQLRVTGTGSYKGTALSPKTNAVLSDTQISGLKLSTTAPVVGNVLKATITPAEANVIYAWKVGGYQVSDAETYTVSFHDIGKQIELIVTGTGVFHGTLSASTAAVTASGIVADVSIVNETSPEASVPTVGDKLAASLSPAQATVFYQWKRDGAPIHGANGSAYVLTRADEGKQISVSVKGVGAYTGEKTSAQTEKVDPKPSVPVIDAIGLPDGVVGSVYSTRLNAQGGGNITWKLVIGSSLPAGLELAQNGTISGTPTTAGSATFFVIASNAAGTSVARKFTIEIKDVPKTYTLTIDGGETTSNLLGNASVTITAAAPAAGQVFSGWTLVSGEGNFENANNLTTTFYLNNSNAVVKPVYTAASDPAVTYTLTVENGVGSANGLAGNAVVDITANAPAANQQFAGWLLVSGSGNFYNANALTTTFYMNSSDAVIRATYEDVSTPVPVPTTYTLTVENGTGSKSGLTSDEMVEISAYAPAEGKIFAGWTLVSGNGNFYNSTSMNTSFVMNGSNATVRAEYIDEPVAPTYTLTVENGEGSKSGLSDGDVVEIVADAPAEGMEFAGWTLVSGSGNFYSAANASTTFYIAGSNATVRAEYISKPVAPTYTLTVENGSGSKSGLSVDDAVQITADAPAEGMVFDSWRLISGNGSFYRAVDATTTFYIGSSDTTIRAEYKAAPAPRTYTLAVENGEGSAEYLNANAIVTIVANSPAEGQTFSHWTLESGDGNFYSSLNATTDFYLKGADAVVRANYKPAE